MNDRTDETNKKQSPKQAPSNNWAQTKRAFF